MHVFIVGATGVIGRDLVPALTARGDRVTALVRSLERADRIAGPGVDLIEGDLLQDSEERLTEVMAGCDAVAHLATALRAGSPGLGTTNTSAELRTTGVSKLLAAAARAGVSRYIQQSIAFAYVDVGDEWIDEATPLEQAPDSRMRVIEQMESLVRASSLEWVILRGGAFTGPDTFQDGVIARLRAGDERVPGDGSNWVSFVHVSDYADAVVAALDAPSRSVFNITAEPVRNGDYMDHLSELLGVPAAPRDADAPMPRSYRCSNAAAREAMGWAPRRPIWPEPQQLEAGGK